MPLYLLFTNRKSDFSQCSWDKKIASLKGGEEGMPWIFMLYCCILLTDNSPKCQAIELYLWVGMLPQHKLGITRPLQLLFQHRCRSKQQMKWCAFLFFNFFCHVSTTKGSNLTSDVISPLRIRKVTQKKQVKPSFTNYQPRDLVKRIGIEEVKPYWFF